MFLRWRVLTHKRVQIQLASIFLLWFVVFIAGTATIFMVSFSSVSDRTKDMLIHDKLLTNMLLVEQTKQLALYYGLATLVYLILAWSYVLVYSHRLTGPVYKLTRIIDKAIHNKTWPDRITLRKTDAFPELAQKWNELVKIMKEDSPPKD